MGAEMEIQLKHCFEFLAKIKAAYPKGEFDREMLHGDMDFRYRRISEFREKLQALPSVVYDFARFKNTLKSNDEAVKAFFHSILEEPERYAALVGLKFPERRKRVAAWASELNIPASCIDELLTRGRLSGILDADYTLKKDYRSVIVAFLAL